MKKIYSDSKKSVYQIGNHMIEVAIPQISEKERRERVQEIKQLFWDYRNSQKSYAYSNKMPFQR